MKTKENLKGFLFVYSSQAAYNTYKDLYRSGTVTKLLLLDLTDFSGQSVRRSESHMNEVKIYDEAKKLKIPNLLKKAISLFLFRKNLSKIVHFYRINHIVIEIDKEPIFLMIITFCNKNFIKTTCFQHGLYQSTEEYDAAVYKERFSEFGLMAYKLSRKMLHFLKILPERRPIGQNHVTQYFFYSEYYRDMFVNLGADSEKIRIVGPTKYAYLKRGNDHKKDEILYGNLLFGRWYSHLSISDESILSAIINNIPGEFTLIVKPHPSESNGLYEACLKSTCSKPHKVTIMEPDANIQNLLKQSKLLITYASSLIYDAIFFDTLVVILDLSEFGLSKFEDSDLFSVTLDEIRGEIITKIIQDKALFNDLIQRQKKFFEKHLGENVDLNAQRFINNLFE